MHALHAAAAHGQRHGHLHGAPVLLPVPGAVVVLLEAPQRVHRRRAPVQNFWSISVALPVRLRLRLERGEVPGRHLIEQALSGDERQRKLSLAHVLDARHRNVVQHAHHLVRFQLDSRHGSHLVGVAVEHFSSGGVAEIAKHHHVVEVELPSDALRVHIPHLSCLSEIDSVHHPVALGCHVVAARHVNSEAVRGLAHALAA
mmetsp:Transcript_33185/g.72377  ORF Transcript_33185/g.72377 Transcript_33185/m.72377 type:complete len:201 (-) Transcript_33185:929-1531(-)